MGEEVRDGAVGNPPRTDDGGVEGISGSLDEEVGVIKFCSSEGVTGGRGTEVGVPT